MKKTSDNETNHMVIIDKQQEWMNNILKQLNELYKDEKKITMKADVAINVPL